MELTKTCKLIKNSLGDYIDIDGKIYSVRHKKNGKCILWVL